MSSCFYNTLASKVFDLALSNSSRVAFVRVDNGVRKSATWADVAGWGICLAGELDRIGLHQGAHVGSILPNGPEWIAVDLACQMLGLVHVAIDARLPPAAIVRLAMHSESAMCLTTPSLQSQLVCLFPAAIPCHTLQCHDNSARLTRQPYAFEFNAPAIALDQLANWQARAHSARRECPAMLLYTSGTTDLERGVVLSHNNLLTNALAKLDAAPQFASDLRLNILPFSHAYARTCELSTWILSGSSICIANSWDNFLQLAPIIRPTLANLVPHLVGKLTNLMENSDETNSSPRERLQTIVGDCMRLLQVGGASLPIDPWNQLAQAGLPPLQGYGLTETSPVVCSNRAGSQRPDSVGPAVMGVEVRLDQDGVLWTRGPHVMLGYWRDDHSTRTRIHDGWLNTGDIAEQTQGGHFRIIGRQSDLIVLSTGYKVSPHSIESQLASDPWIDRLVLIGEGQPHISALVWLNRDAVPEHFMQRDSLVRALTQRIRLKLTDSPRYAIPEKLTIVEGRFPQQYLTAKGSIRRQKLLSAFEVARSDFKIGLS